MARHDQLEIIYPDGKIKFHDLDPAKGITTIGRHPDNDIQIDSPNVGAFEAVFDHQKKPFRFVILNTEGTARFEDRSLPANSFHELHDWQTIELDGHTITLLQNLEGMAAPAAPPQGLPSAPTGGQTGDVIQAAVIPAEISSAAALTAEAGQPQPVEPGMAQRIVAPLFASRPPDEKDETIFAELNPREWTIHVEETAVAELTVANAGKYVADFSVCVEGIDSSWVNINPQKINLVEGARGTVFISMIPGEAPTSYAGPHHFMLVVTSDVYPGHVTRLGATLQIEPYYKFSVDNIEPRQQSSTWRQPAAAVTMKIENQGNSLSSFRVMAQDDENSCKFEFQTGPNVNLVRQAELNLQPGEAITLPVTIQPNRRSLVRLQPRRYQYSITTQSLNDSAAARMVSGTFVNRPLFGPFSVLAAVIGLLIAVYIIFLPRITDFTATPSLVPLGQPVNLAWKVSPFTDNLQVRFKAPEDAQSRNIPDELKTSQNQINVVPATTLTSYTLVAANWLTRLLPLPEVNRTTHAVLAIPAYPEVSTFLVDKRDVSLGQEITVKWAVKNAASAVIRVENVPTPLTKEELSGEKTFKLTKNSLVVIEAQNDSGTAVQSEYVRVWDPKDLEYSFKIDPPTVVKGSPVTVSWKVTGKGFAVDNVVVSPFTDPLPAEYQMIYYPTDTMYFVLKAKVGSYEKTYPPEPVTVLPSDAKPVINYFKATPPKLTSSGNVEFSWSVSGPVDSIVISNKSGPVANNLAPQGFQTIPVGVSATYVLTAKKGIETAAAVVDVEVSNLLDVNIAIKSVVPASGILRNVPIFVYFSLSPKDTLPNMPEVSGSVVITDGFDSCEVKLPIASCEFTFHRSGTGKQLVATYSGDSNYRRTTSAQYPGTTAGITVIGSTVQIKTVNITYTAPDLARKDLRSPAGLAAVSYPVVGQYGYLIIDMIPTGSNSSTPVQGNFDVLVDQNTPMCLGGALEVVNDAFGVAVGRATCKFVFFTPGKKIFTFKYQGNEIFEPFESDPAMAQLNVTVSAAPTLISFASQTPQGTAQVGQPVNLSLQVNVSAPGGGLVTGAGTVKVTDISGKVYCSAALAAGIANCSFVPIQTSDNLFFDFTPGDINSYLPYSTNCGTSCTGSEIKYKISNAYANVTIVGTTLIPAVQGQVNPFVGQKVGLTLKVTADVTGSDLQMGSVFVYLADPVNPTAQQKCKIDLPKPQVYCEIVILHGGKNIITTGYTDATNNYFGKTLGAQSLSVDPAPVKINNLAASPAGQSVEGSTTSVSFSLSSPYAISLAPTGAYSVKTDGINETCTGTIPAQPTCGITFQGNANTNRTITVSFGDGKDYVPVTASLQNYTVLHKTTTTVLNSSQTPVVNGSVQMNFSVVPAFPVAGMPAIGGNVRVAISQNSAEYGVCTANLTVGGCTLAALKPGDNTVRAEFLPDSGSPYSGSISTAFILQVNRITSTLTLVPPLPTAYVGDMVTYTLRVSQAPSPANISPPTGTALISAKQGTGLTVCQNVITLKATSLGYSEGTCAMKFNAAGSWDLYAEYSGDTNYNQISPAVALGLKQSINRFPTQVSSLTFVKKSNGALVEFSYSVVKGAPTTAADISGSVNVYVGVLLPIPTYSCTGGLKFNAATNSWDGTCPVSLPPGIYAAYAVYSGDTNFDVSRSIDVYFNTP